MYTNSGFTIARLEQSYGSDSKYKMTTQYINQYLHWININHGYIIVIFSNQKLKQLHQK